MMFTRSRSVLTILLCAFALAAGAFAQTSSTTGEIAGRVVDDSDAVLPGVTAAGRGNEQDSEGHRGRLGRKEAGVRMPFHDRVLHFLMVAPGAFRHLQIRPRALSVP